MEKIDNLTFVISSGNSLKQPRSCHMKGAMHIIVKGPQQSRNSSKLDYLLDLNDAIAELTILLV